MKFPQGNTGKKPGQTELETHILGENSRRRKWRTNHGKKAEMVCTC
jgi:hypothetical protein